MFRTIPSTILSLEQLGAPMIFKEAMASSGRRGMQTFDMALHELYKEGKISLEEALSNADSRTNLEAKINFG